MKITYVILILLFLCPICYGAPDTTATRPNTYTTGSTVDPDENNSNENTIYNAYNAHSHTDINATTETTFTIGDDDDIDHSYIVNNGDANNPRLRYDAGNSRWEFSNDGTTFFPIQASASVAGILDGFEIFYDRVHPADAIKASGGSVIIGGQNLSAISVSESLMIGSDAFWIGGSASDNASTWIYTYVFNSGDVASFNFSTTAPNSIDELGNTGGRLKWYVTGGVAYRCIGTIRNSTNANITSFNMVGNLVMWDSPIGITSVPSAGAWSNPLPCSAGIPETSTLGIFGLYSSDTDSRNSGTWIRPNGTTWSTNEANGIWIDTAGTEGDISGQRECMTDGAQQINYRNDAGDEETLISVEGYRDFLR